LALTAIAGSRVVGMSRASAATEAPLPVTYSALPALARTLATPEADPPGANDWSCRSTEHPTPVLLVHGTNANMTLNWNTLSPLLKNNGYCVFALNYGGLKFGQVGGQGDVVASAGELARFVDRILAATGASKVDFVGHSQGGMLPQYYVKFLNGASRTRSIVGLAPTSHGSTFSGFNQLIDAFAAVFPPLVEGIDRQAPSMRQQLVGSEFMRKLTSVPDTVPGVRYTVIASKYDGVVTPYQSQFLDGPGVRNITVQDDCANDFGEHL
jgi:triacylglycerol esterase/lipase EstA (alpha/beta hydrolase family)